MTTEGDLSYEDIVELTEGERRALPPRYHRPFFDGLGRPHFWVCQVCWGDSTFTCWPCPPAVVGGAELAKLLGLEYAW